MLNVCNDGHAEVVYDGRYCPMCSLTEEKDNEIADLKRTIEEKENVIADLQSSMEAQRV